MDWFASGGPRAGREAVAARAGDIARGDVPTCRPDERCGDIAARVRAGGSFLCVVLDDERVVLGLLDTAALEREPDALAADAMRAAPTTIRPHVLLQDTLTSMTARRRDQVLVTTSDGRLIGLLRRADVERRLGRAA
jgi:CBS domain-containing protein